MAAERENGPGLKVVPLHPDHGEPAPEVMEVLDAASAHGRTGKLRSVMIVAVDKDGQYCAYHSTVNRYEMAGAMEHVKMRLLRYGEDS